MQDLELDEIKKQLETSFLRLNKKNNYQIFLIVFMCFAWVLTTFISMVGGFVFMNPIFQCNGENVPEKQACQNNLSGCKITNDFTAVFYADLYCQRQFLRSVIQSAFFLGSIVSMFTLVPLSDTKGRRLSIVIALFLCVFGSFLLTIGIYSKISFLMCLGQFFNGASMGTMTVMSYVITGELTDDNMRQKSILIYNSMWGLGLMLFLPIYYWLPEWYNFLILCSLVPNIGVFIISIFGLLQTPFYCLFLAKNLERFKNTIQVLASYNRSDPQDVQKMKNLGQKYIKKSKTLEISKLTFKETMKIISKKENLVPIICISLMISSFSSFYFGMQGSMERTGYNFGISIFVGGLHQFICYLLVSFVVSKIPRKKGFLVSTIATTILGLSFLIPFVKQSSLLQTILISFARVATIFGYSFVAFFQTEAFGQNVKSTAFGITQGANQTIKFFVPFVIISMNNLNIHPIIPFSIFYLIFGTVPLLFIKQTLKRNVKQSENKTGKQSLLNSQSLTQTQIN